LYDEEEPWSTPATFSFFKKIYANIISKGHGFVALASYQNRNIAGRVYFHFGGKALYKYGASDHKYQHLRANNLVMWETIKWYSKNGYKSLCFGRTEPENQGLIQFKSGWGTTQQRINYYRYDFRKEKFICAQSKVKGFYNRIFKNMPIPLLIGVGSILYKHAG
jgi:lipid II:glycine glycyltransferase (peptidoglycan interpeptide bridge formation enzyme)